MNLVEYYINWFINLASAYQTEADTTLNDYSVIRAHSIDYDGCLAHSKYKIISGKTLIEHNTSLLRRIQRASPADKTILFVGSLRQSYEDDCFNQGLNENGSCFIAMKQLSEHLGVELDTFLLSDIKDNLPPGTSFENALDPDFSGKHSQSIGSDMKYDLVYAQMHKLAQRYRSHPIVFTFYDDRDDILDAINRFFSAAKNLIPQNVTLCLVSYDPQLRNLGEIKGEGVVDNYYRKTVLGTTLLNIREAQLRAHREAVSASPAFFSSASRASESSSCSSSSSSGIGAFKYPFN